VTLQVGARSGLQPSCVHGHFALSRASSRQSGRKALERAATLIQNQVLMI